MDPVAPIDRWISELQGHGLVDHVAEEGMFARWLANAAAAGVEEDVIIDLVRRGDVDQRSLSVLESLPEVRDRDGKSFFLLPERADASLARRAVLATYVLNARTDYGAARDGTGTSNDFEEELFSVEELERIRLRQRANGWSYAVVLAAVHRLGARVATTPNGLLMGLGGSPPARVLSQRGGTTWGDLFLLNVRAPDAAEVLEAIVVSGVRPTSSRRGRPGGPGPTRGLDLDRLLHHEERHARQWAAQGPARFCVGYLLERWRGSNRTEEDAGLADGGYR